jgi:opacity protein-like surface antigen
MKRTLLAAAAAVALAVPAGFATAQDTTVAVDAAGNAVVLTTEQQAMYDAWPADRRATYDAWPIEARRYYWTLNPNQTEGWWMLSDEQRVRIVGMTPEQRTAAWASIAAQMNSRASSEASTTGQMASSGTMTGGAMQFVRREMVQPVADSTDTAAAQSGDLPVCTKNQQDNCINGWEKNRRGNKPLSYWPGKPASEIPGKKPDPAAGSQ